MTLDDFIISAIARQALTGHPQRLHVKQPGFSTLYVRITQRTVLGRTWKPVLDLSSADATHPGKGAFKKLLSHLKEKYPTLPLYAENVLNEKLVVGLRKRGFIDLGPEGSPCMFLPPEEHHDQEERRDVQRNDEGPVQDASRARHP